VHARQHLAHLGGVCGCGQAAVAAGQARHHRGGFSTQAVHQAAVGRWLWCGHRDAVRREVLHQAQVVGQLFGAQALKQRQHPLALRRAGVVVGVFDARTDAVQIGQGTQPQAPEQRVGGVEADFGVDRHGVA
jgi:hypothetical protein